ncbi:hypothetical protein J4Q44_G00369970 [Coregonus suidteri]|uniref:Uncharacterized protein n=1 Tax=Coregonus suidteri TaxID=861788 RepID=A0AAN8QDL1_9TELE
MKSNGNMCNADNLGSHDDGTTAAQQVAMEEHFNQNLLHHNTTPACGLVEQCPGYLCRVLGTVTVTESMR